jgi:hypothetical protein
VQRYPHTRFHSENSSRRLAYGSGSGEEISDNFGTIEAFAIGCGLLARLNIGSLAGFSH